MTPNEVTKVHEPPNLATVASTRGFIRRERTARVVIERTSTITVAVSPVAIRRAALRTTLPS